MKNLINEINTVLKPYTSDLWPQDPIILYGLGFVTITFIIVLVAARSKVSKKLSSEPQGDRSGVKDYKVNTGD